MTHTNPTQINATGAAVGFVPAPGNTGQPIAAICPPRPIPAEPGGSLRQLRLPHSAGLPLTDPVARKGI
jgi:hypothetical protein